MKGTAKVTPKIEKYVYYMFTGYTFSCSEWNLMQVIQTCINFVDQRLKFFHLKGGIIP